MKNTRAQNQDNVLCSLLMLVTNVHTGETKEISISTRERKMFPFFLVNVLVLISHMFTPGFCCACACTYITHC